MEKYNPELGDLVTCVCNGSMFTGLILAIDDVKNIITLQECDLLEARKLYYVDPNVRTRLDMDSITATYVYSNFKEIKKCEKNDSS